MAELQEIDNEIENSPDFKGNAILMENSHLKSSQAMKNANMYKDIQI